MRRRGPAASAPVPGSAGQAPQRVQVGRSKDGVSPWGAPRRMHTVRQTDPAPPGSEGEHGQGLGRLAHNDDPCSPPKRGPRPRPLQCSCRLLRSRAVGVVFRRSLQRPYLCRGLHPLRGLVSGIAGNRITADFGGPRAELLAPASAPAAILATPKSTF
ncbi:hypothetical protein NDU88_001810 [Pleurodeles waltl]|uniref:Uncharacterized protein n=1 Tax=Pleurodeles waltl TaxID=8319 RepID=A0AAV7U7G7_PLEWA|nr:hypothetical protein NDU88_001810 [Pleurodeles waltl]